MNKPLITIGITSYREGDWLRECWDSVLAQTDPRWEAIMVLDGGADQPTRQIFDQLEHPQLRKYAMQKNVGPYLCRTLAILNANADWYAHLDGDDLLPENAVMLILNTITNNPQSDFVYGDDVYFNVGQAKKIKERCFSPQNLIQGMDIQGTAPIKRNLFFQFGGFAPELLNGGADWDFWLSVVEKHIKASKIDGVTYLRRNRQGSLSKTRAMRNDQIASIIIGRHPVFFSVGERKNQCLGKAYATVAMNYKTNGKRRLAALYAEKARKLGYDFDAYQTIQAENRMNPIRYLLRRLGRYL